MIIDDNIMLGNLPISIQLSENGHLQIEVLPDDQKIQKISGTAYPEQGWDRVEIIWNKHSSLPLKQYLRQFLSSELNSAQLNIFLDKDETGKFKLNPTDDDEGYTTVFKLTDTIEYRWVDQNLTLVRDPQRGPTAVRLYRGSVRDIIFTLQPGEHTGSFRSVVLRCTDLYQAGRLNTESYIQILIQARKWFNLRK